MLVLSRKVGEEIVIDRTIRVTVIQVKGDRVRLGVQAPDSVTIDRREIFDLKLEFDAPRKLGQDVSRPA